MRSGTDSPDEFRARIAPWRCSNGRIGSHQHSSSRSNWTSGSMPLAIRVEAAMRHPNPTCRPPALVLSTPIRQRYKSTQLTRRMVTVAISSEIM
jgi:hypothetical protein